MATKPLAWILIGTAWLSARAVQAKPVDAWFEVARSPGSESCPDEAAVLEAIRALFPEMQIRRSSDATHARTRAHIAIRPAKDGHEATLQVNAGERRIATQQADCTGLGDALAVALVLMLEAQPQAPLSADAALGIEQKASSATPNAVSTTPAATPNAVSTAPVTASHKPKEAAERSPGAARSISGPPEHAGIATQRSPAALEDRASAPRSSWQLHAMASGLFGMGVLSQPAGGAQLGAALFHRSRLGIATAGQRWWSLPAEEAGGSVAIDLWAVTLAPCLNALASKTQLWICATLGFGMQHAVAEGYRVSGEATRPWFALGPRLQLSQRLARQLFGVVGVTALAQPRRETFAVDGVGQVARAHTLGIIVELGLRFDSK